LINDKNIIPRMSQMSQKTNQFNLTTKRYTESDISRFIEDPEFDIMAFSVADKFGDNGICGLCVMKSNKEYLSVEIETLLMSCRVIGRNIEYSFMDYLIRFLKEKNIKYVDAKYIKTPKNQQTEIFYEQCSFSFISQLDSDKKYQLNVVEYLPRNLDYIEVCDGR
jgi:FkbH-like protein